MQQTNKDLKRNILLDQGVLLLTEKGYHGTGLKEILDAVKIPKGSFYNYFSSKEEYCAEVITHYIKPFIFQLDNHLKNPEINALTALQRYFDELITELENSNFKEGCLLGNLMGELGGTSEICRNALNQAVQRYNDLLKDGLEQAQQQGLVRTDKTAQSMANLLVNGWQGALLRMKIEQSSAPLKECCQDLLHDYFLN
ncbi:MAG TPA: TetR family transcriptional regulator [Methylococcaceae bacterium]|jgi:TetR/AcrR family transcriptional repressor of nem operon|nr:TetR family transcriptional regulator [Methylococcaceae bacterium]